MKPNDLVSLCEFKDISKTWTLYQNLCLFELQLSMYFDAKV